MSLAELLLLVDICVAVLHFPEARVLEDPAWSGGHSRSAKQALECLPGTLIR
jgi:hypothetical protein